MNFPWLVILFGGEKVIVNSREEFDGLDQSQVHYIYKHVEDEQASSADPVIVPPAPKKRKK